MRAPSTSGRDHLSAVVADKQMRGECLGRFFVRVSENGHSVHTVDAACENERAVVPSFQHRWP